MARTWARCTARPARAPTHGTACAVRTGPCACRRRCQSCRRCLPPWRSWRHRPPQQPLAARAPAAPHMSGPRPRDVRATHAGARRSGKRVCARGGVDRPRRAANATAWPPAPHATHRRCSVILPDQSVAREIPLGGQRRHATAAGRGDGLPPLGVVQVARSKHASHAGRHAVVHLRKARRGAHGEDRRDGMPGRL